MNHELFLPAARKLAENELDDSASNAEIHRYAVVAAKAMALTAEEAARQYRYVDVADVAARLEERLK